MITTIAPGHRVMGIDPGLTRCGLSVVQSGGGRSVYPVAVGVVRTPATDELPSRLKQIHHAVRDWIREYDPDVIAIERVFERGNVSTVMQTAHAVGVLLLAAAEAEIPVEHYTPSEVKKAITGNGRADKKQMTSMITRILGLSAAPKPADAADALALAVCHLWRGPIRARERQATIKAQNLTNKLQQAQQQAQSDSDENAPLAQVYRLARPVPLGEMQGNNRGITR